MEAIELGIDSLPDWIEDRIEDKLERAAERGGKDGDPDLPVSVIRFDRPVVPLMAVSPHLPISLSNLGRRIPFS